MAKNFIIIIVKIRLIVTSVITSFTSTKITITRVLNLFHSCNQSHMKRLLFPSWIFEGKISISHSLFQLYLSLSGVETKEIVYIDIYFHPHQLLLPMILWVIGTVSINNQQLLSTFSLRPLEFAEIHNHFR